MTHKTRASQVNPIDAIDSQGNVERWEFFKSETSGLWTLRDQTGVEIEFTSVWSDSKWPMFRALKNRGLTAKL